MPLYPANVNIDFDATALNAAVASTTNAINALETRLDSNEDSITNITTQLTNQNTRLNSIEVAETRVGNAVTALENRVGSNEDVIANNATAIGGQQSQIDSINNSVISLNSGNAALYDYANTIGQKVNAQAQTISFLDGQNAVKTVAIQSLQDKITALENALPQGFQHFHDTSKVLVGSGLSFVQVAASFYATMWQQSPAALNDSFSFTALLAPGTYTLVMLVTRANNKGKLKLSINGVQAFDDLDGYNSTTIYERITRTITITTSGLQQFVFTVWGKNASSTGYAFLINKISAYK
ncbi:MAG: hypothetical protein V7K41_29940 [Nostoc sp.]|uniref:hypothetical protein n=1 Tax=Nostoc sp. TaxID=1180 RepID=UPI002FF5BD9E